MAQIERYLRTYTSSAALLLSVLANVTIGVLLLIRQPVLIAATPYMLSGLFVGMFFVEIVRMISNGARFWSAGLLRLLAYAGSAGMLLKFPGMVWYLLPLGMALYVLMMAVAAFISFWQYRNERSTTPLRYLFSAILHLIFALCFWFNWLNMADYSVVVIGIYLLFFASSQLLDFLDEVAPERFKERIRRRLHVPMPLFLATFMPMRALKAVNRYYEKVPDAPTLSTRKDGGLADVEIFIHMSRHGANAIGHVDIVVDGTMYSYGGYDEPKMKLFGGMGPGVLFMLENTDAYIRMSTMTPESILIAYGLDFTPEQMEKLREKLREILSRTVEFKPDAQRVAEGLMVRKKCRDYMSRLYKHCDARFCKFSSGSYKHYFVLGTNCVTLVDELLGAAGAGWVASSIISPGTYYTYLDTEFARKGSPVVYRRVYRHRKRERSEPNTD